MLSVYFPTELYLIFVLFDLGLARSLLHEFLWTLLESLAQPSGMVSEVFK
jgi:hypothetical protein